MRRLSKAVWANGPLKSFLSSQSLSLWGSWFHYIALAAWLYAQTGSALWLGGLAAGQQMVVMLASPMAGHGSKRLGVRRMYGRAQLVGIVFSGAFALCAGLGWLTPVLAVCLALMLAFSGAIEGACRQAFLLSLSKNADPHEAVGLDAMIYNLAKILGPMLGALAYAKLGLAWCFALNCLSFIIAYAAVARPLASDDPPCPEAQSMGLWSAMRSLASARDIQKTLAGYALCGFCVSPHLSIFPALHALRFPENAASLGWLYSVGGAGGLLASFAMSSLARGSRPALLICGGAMCAAGLVGLSCSSSLPAALLCVALLNMGGGFCLSTMQVLLLSCVEGPQRAMAIGVGLSAYYGAYMLGALALGALAESQGIAASYLVMASLFACAGVWMGPALARIARARLA